MFLLGSSALLLALMLAICNLVIGAVALRQISTGRRGPISPERLSDAARRAGIIGFPAVSAAVFQIGASQQLRRLLPLPARIATEK